MRTHQVSAWVRLRRTLPRFTRILGAAATPTWSPEGDQIVHGVARYQLPAGEPTEDQIAAGQYDGRYGEERMEGFRIFAVSKDANPNPRAATYRIWFGPESWGWDARVWVDLTYMQVRCLDFMAAARNYVAAVRRMLSWDSSLRPADETWLRSRRHPPAVFYHVPGYPQQLQSPQAPPIVLDLGNNAGQGGSAQPNDAPSDLAQMAITQLLGDLLETMP